MKKHLSKDEIKKAKHSLDNDGVFAFPTDTVWGIGCLPTSEQACRKIYEIKKRDGNKPLILLGASIEDLSPYISDMPDLAKTLAEKYWPGALTIILKKSNITNDYITSGFDTVGIRIPNHPVLLELLKATGPITSTSANLSSEQAAISKSHIKNIVLDKLDFVLDDYGIPCAGKESTVIIMNKDSYKVLRHGAIDLKERI